jgi:Class III cytochrome C family
VKGRWLWIVIGANLLMAVALAFVYPHLMVSPGPLIPGHAALATDCFACHAPLRGATTERCIACHAVPDIGLRTTQGTPIRATNAGRATPLKMSFHQELIEQDCMACHSDHAGPRLTQRNRNPFSHALLRVATRDSCDSCHAAPSNAMHRSLSVGCAQCHKTEGWKSASFDHAALPRAELSRCEACHRAPTDTLHRRINGQCAQCHTPKAWKPATFEHDKLFVLDKDHNASCATCHLADDYGKYTCYGCHEHTPANVRAKHVEEGIQNFENCVECHRSANEEPEGKDGREGDGNRKRD